MLLRPPRISEIQRLDPFAIDARNPYIPRVHWCRGEL